MLLQFSVVQVSMFLKPSERPQVNKAYEQKISLINILTCLICTNKAVQAHICPNCSKFYCEICIKDWIVNKDKACPSCRKQIDVGSLVNCNKLSQDLSSALQALIQFQFPGEAQCESHSLTLSYYCEDCNLPLCSDCHVLSESHKGHKFIKINKIKVSYNEKVLCLLSKIKSRRKFLEKQQNLLIKETNSDNLKQKIDLLMYRMNKIKESYKNSATGYLQRELDQLLTQKMSIKSYNVSYSAFLSTIQQLSKVKLVEKPVEDLQSNLEALIRSTSSLKKKGTQKQVQNIKESRIGLKKTCKTFILDNYSHLRNKDEVIYSDIFYDGFNEWRLKIHPNGVENIDPLFDSSSPDNNHFQPSQNSQKFSRKKDQYISIYIELKSGARKFNRFQHKIELVNQIDQSKKISQVYESQFEVGECWGYNHFANIQNLYREGYIHPKQDSLKINVEVGTPSFYHACLDLTTVIQTKEQALQINKNRISQMKKKLNLTSQAEKQPINENQNNSNKIENKEIKGITQVDLKRIRYVKIRAQKVKVDNKCGEQFDHQSKQLNKIYGRISSCHEKDFLIF